MQCHDQLHRRLSLSFLSWILLISIGFSLFCFSRWNSAIDEAGKLSESDVAITAIILKQSILDSSKVLDVIKKGVEPLLLSRSPIQTDFNKGLSKALSIFSIDFDISNYGIVYLIDANGNLIARSDQKPLVGINLSDRYFFKKLKSDPNKRFIVSSLVKSRTTNKPITSVVTPIKNAQGDFIGVLGLQMDPTTMEALLKKQIHQPEETITVLSENNDIFLTVPLTAITPNSQGGITFKDTALLTHPRDGKWFRTNKQIIAKTTIPEVGISVISQIEISEVLQKFFWSDIKFFSFLLGSGLIFSFIFYLFNKKILKADAERIHSMVDELTQLPNRRAFDENYGKILKDAHRNTYPVSALFIDIDHFKLCNDSYGHENGDIILKKICTLIQKCMRRPDDFCSRWGGEEIVCLLPGTSLEGASKLAQIILETVENEPITIKGFPPIHLTLSIGIANASHSNALFEGDLIDQADQAMYRAKQQGRNRCSI